MHSAVQYQHGDYSKFHSIGFSTDSQVIENALDEVIAHFRESVSLGRLDIFDSLFEIYRRCAVEDWDGYGALPINENAYTEAIKLIELLPSSLPMPEITAEPSGEIGMEWRKGKRQIFVVSLSGKNTLTYAGIFGINKAHGTEYFGESIPHVIIENIRRLHL